MNKHFFLLFVFVYQFQSYSQSQNNVYGKIVSENKAVANANVTLIGTKFSTQSNTEGYFILENIADGKHKIMISSIGYLTLRQDVLLPRTATDTLIFSLKKNDNQLDEIVVSGTF